MSSLSLAWNDFDDSGHYVWNIPKTKVKSTGCDSVVGSCSTDSLDSADMKNDDVLSNFSPCLLSTGVHEEDSAVNSAHISVLYETEEEFCKMIGPAFYAGFLRNELMVFLYYTHTKEEMIEIFEKAGLPMAELLESGQFILGQEYLDGGDSFERLRVLKMLETTRDEAICKYTGLRACGEMAWTHMSCGKNYSELGIYEAEVSKIKFDRCTFMCVYDLHKTEPKFISQSLYTHPLVFYKGHILHNFYFVDPTTFIDKSDTEINKNVVIHWCEHLMRESKLQKDLIKAKNVALNAAEAKGNFLAQVTHEVRTPMYAILSYSNLLSEKKEGDVMSKEDVEMLRTVHKSGQHLLQIIDNVLDITKIEQDKVVLENEKFDLVELVSEVAFVFRNKAKMKGIELKFSTKNLPEELFVVFDSVRVRQVILNLISNAIKFTSRGTVDFIVEGSESDQPNHKAIKLCVKDTGIGIAEDDLEKIFLPLEQANSSISRTYGGTGLGLSISEKLCELMGTELKCESVFGKGSVFYFDLDLLLASDGDSLSFGPSKSTCDLIHCHTQHSKVDVSGMKILMAEDNLVNQKVTMKLLSRLGVTDVKVVGDGDELLEHLKSEETLPQYDLILLDVQMPHLDGFETKAQMDILYESRNAIMPTVSLLTACADVHTKKKAQKANIDMFLLKPISMIRLGEVLKEVLE